jgi:lipoprotein-anchoring transpeptidase ErfK/SrfK
VIILLFALLGRGALAATLDTDKDGLSDYDEINLYKTDPKNADTDGDGYPDGLEVSKGYSPHNKQPGARLEKKIEVDTKKQELSYFIDNIKIDTFKVSTGKKSTPTPKGSFKIINKSPRAWSKTYGLWMPYWQGLGNGKFGLHELPEWPNGYKEGAKHLGIPVSHGCIRLGVGSAKKLYSWTEIGTMVKIN